jgi:ketosteroid isomerase-like protein
MMAAFDGLDLDAATGLMSSDAQGVDEISRRWLRDRGEIDAYFRELSGQLSDVRTELSGIDERVYGDVGVATMWLEQDYRWGGEDVHVSAPTTMVLRREEGAWKVALVHSIPLPEAG